MQFDGVSQLLRFVLDSLPIGVVLLDTELRLLYMNPAQAQTNGLPIDAMLGKRPGEYMPREAAMLIEPRLRFVLENGVPLVNQDLRASLPSPDGSVFHRIASYYPWRGTDGAACGILAIVQDLTEPSTARKLVEQSQRQLLKVLDTLYTFVGVLDLDGTLVSANRAPLDAAGICIDEVKGKAFWECHWWCYDSTVQALLRSAIDRCRNGEIVRFDVPVRMKGESIMWIDFMLAPLRDDDGVVTQLIPSGIDISDRHAQEVALHASEERLRSIISSSDEAIITKSLDGIITSWNPAAERLLGYSDSEAIGRPITMLFPPERLVEEKTLMALIVRGERVEPFETQRIHREGRILDVSVTISPLRDKHGNVIGACKLARDIQGQKRERELQDAALQEKTALFHEIHHRVKNNLQVVSSLLNLQSRQASPEAAQLLAESQARIKAMALVHQLLYESNSLSTLSAGEFVSRLMALIGEIYNAREAKIVIRVSVPTATIYFSAKRVVPCGLIINELVLNSIKHAFQPHVGGVIDVNMKYTDSGLVRIRVSDNGCGLPDGFDWSVGTGLGSQLIPMFAQQLKGELIIEPSLTGTSIEIGFHPDNTEA
ncbi:PAS domain S-box protein [Chitinimonas sp.]|uniref:PAS domain-containing sensor histidine kinase n=1 Tax=Chitinimonas sp. TaxID=1934313 RepID=UPI0035B3984C